MEVRINPAIWGALEKKIIEGTLRLKEAHRILNYLKRLHGYECIPFEKLCPFDPDEDGIDQEDVKPVKENEDIQLMPSECIS